MPPSAKVSRGPGRGGAEGVDGPGNRQLAQPGDLGRLQQDRRADVGEHRVEVALTLGEERIEKAGCPGIVHRLQRPALEEPAVLEEDVYELPEQVVGRLGELLVGKRVAARGFEFPLGAER